jgi:serine/threonine protein kinase/tetratricopeptide (TPR) repeat protein
MPEASHDSRSNDDSARDALADWNLRGDSELDSGSAPDLENDPSRGTRRKSSQRPSTVGWGSGQSFELLAGFELDAPDDDAIPQRDFPTVDHLPGASARTTGLGPASTSGSRFQRPREELPRPGDELAGFRILTELGRGAFARVYLAEEINLGRRLVAIKVSRPDGDEPQILARLQHTHIVPVHSVCDDPASGLRILCMPYFGGADLARVLRTAGGLVPTRHDGGSLVKALDQLSRNLPVPSALAPTYRSVRPLRSLHSSPGPPALHANVSITPASQAFSTTSRFRRLLTRLVRTDNAALSGCTDTCPDQGEPSRHFLRGASAIQAAVWIVARLAEGLEHSHARGLLHRDLKPSNILLAADGTPMLLDFNLAVIQQASSPEGEIRKAMVGGTLPYMSPEHLDAFNPHGSTREDDVDERSDIYALGLILFEMLAGDPPFPEPTPGITFLETIKFMRDSRRQPPSLRERCRHIPWSLDALTAKCLAYEPDRRYSHARELAEDLRRFLENLPMKHCPEPSVRERVGKWAKRHPGLCGSTSIAIFALVLLGLMGAAIGLVYDRMQGLAARERHRLFNRDFTETQFLLNTAGGSNEHLMTGIAKAAQTIAQAGDPINTSARWNEWVSRLNAGEGQRLREQIVELILLDARARVFLASQSAREEERRTAIESAIAHLDRAQQIVPLPPSALFTERAGYHDRLGHPELAQIDRHEARKITPSNCHDLTLLGTYLLSAGDRAKAEETLKKALHLEVTSYWTWFVLGHCHYAQGRFLEAASDFSTCVALRPEFAWAQFNRGLALARTGRPREAKYAYDRALEIEPAFSEALVNRAMVELELDQPEAAERDLQRSRELGRDDVVALAALGASWARTGRQAEAQRYFGDLLAQNPSSLVVRVARGFSRIASDPTGARTDFSHVLEQEPHHAHALYGLALLERATDLKTALEHADIALQSDPNLIDALQLRALIRARLGERAALDDVERLVASPTSQHLYNAACALAVYSEKAGDRTVVQHALELLARALDAGIRPAEAAADPDLKPLHRSTQFQRLMARGTRR